MTSRRRNITGAHVFDNLIARKNPAARRHLRENRASSPPRTRTRCRASSQYETKASRHLPRFLIVSCFPPSRRSTVTGSEPIRLDAASPATAAGASRLSWCVAPADSVRRFFHGVGRIRPHALTASVLIPQVEPKPSRSSKRHWRQNLIAGDGGWPTNDERSLTWPATT